MALSPLKASPPEAPPPRDGLLRDESLREAPFPDGTVWLAEQQEYFKQRGSKQAGAGQEKVPVAPFHIEEIDSALFGNGLLLGAIHEWFVSPPLPHSILTRLVINGVKELLPTEAAHRSNAEFRKFIVWIGKDTWPTPFAFEAEQEVDLIPNCIFIDPPSKKLRLWAIDIAIRSPAVAALITDIPKHSLAMSRRFSLLAKKSGVLAFFIRNSQEQHLTSAATTKWSVSPVPSPTLAPRWELKLLREKGRAPQRDSWLIELDSAALQIIQEQELNHKSKIYRSA